MIKKLIDWSESNYGDLPWRLRRSSYTTLVSEIMLQQTTVSTVLNHFDRFIDKYPTIESLALASEEDILIDWKGLGYYRRARNLHRAAQEIVHKYGGVIPLVYDKLIEIGGIGAYTANAILSIGNNLDGICVDANLERVLARVYGIKTDKGPKLQKEIYAQYEKGSIASEMKKVGARKYNEALMDLGRSICKARSTACEICSLNRMCESLRSGDPLSIPMESVKKEKESFELTLLRVIYKKDGNLLVYKKSDQEWLSGQYEIPTFILESEDKTLKQYPWMNGQKELFLLPEFKTGITKYKIVNKVIHVNEQDIKSLLINLNDYKFVNESELENLTTASFKALAL